MNRREALKKLGVGSAVVVGATAVKSLPAFAFAYPVLDPNNPLDVTVNGNGKNLTATISVGIANCSGSALSPCVGCQATEAEILAFSMTAFVVSVTSSGTTYGWGSATPFIIFPTAPSPSGAVVDAPVPNNPYTDPTSGGWGSYTYPLRHLNAAGSSVINAENADTIQITGEVQYRCTYGDGPASISETIDFVFTKVGANGGWSRS